MSFVFGFSPFWLSVLAFFVGLAVPHLIWIVRIPVTTVVLEKQPIRSFFQNLIKNLGDVTINYPYRAIVKVENKVKTSLLPPDCDMCVSKAYEFHRVEICAPRP